MTSEHHETETPRIPEGLVDALVGQIGLTVHVRYRRWNDGDFAVSEGTFRVLEVDTFWPSLVMEQSPGVATRVPLSYVITVSTPEGATVFAIEGAGHRA